MRKRESLAVLLLIQSFNQKTIRITSVWLSIRRVFVKKLLCVWMIVGMVLAAVVPVFAGGEQEVESGKMKVGILLPGNINDSGWNQTAYQGMVAAKEKFDIEISYMESVAQSDQEEAFRNYANEGYDLVIGHGYQFQDAALKVAEDFPDTYFAVLNGSVQQEPNVASYQFTNWQPGYVTGALAGLITETNKIGAIGGQEIPVIKDALEAFRDGARRVNPEANVTITYVDSWTDIAKGKETALAMIDSGADVVVCDANAVGLGSIEACQERGVLAIGFVQDQYEVAPETVVASGIQSNQKLVYYVIEEFLRGNFKAGIFQLGIAEGVEGISPLYDWEEKLPARVIEEVRSIEKRIADKEITWP
jgi:basic membrane protein A